MGLQITIGVSGQAEFSRTLGILMANVKDLRPAWDSIEAQLTKLQKGVFLGKGSFGGLSSWAPLKASTIEQKRKVAGRWAEYPLIRTKKLMNAWTKSGSAGSVRVKEPLFFAFGVDETEVPYVAYHQWGTSRMPARPTLRLPTAVRRSIVKTIQSYLVKSKQFERETLFG